MRAVKKTRSLKVTRSSKVHPEPRARKHRVKKSKRAAEVVVDARPHTSTDGMTWLDPKGSPPRLDDKGRLQEEFILTTDLGTQERWGVGTKLPLTPAANLKWMLEVEAERKQKEKGRGRVAESNGHEPTPANVSGKRRQRTPKSDEGLTEEQKAKRDKRRARREARKQRRAAGSGGK